MSGVPTNSPEDPAAARRNNRISLAVLAAILGIVALVLANPRLLERRGAVEPPPPTAAPAFAGAANRMFLSPDESRQASSRALVPPGTRSILATGKLDFGEWRWDRTNVPAAPVRVRVDLQRQIVSVFQGPDEIGTAVIVYGAEGKETPRGPLPILGKTRDYHSRTYDAPMPYSLWLRDDGVALHGSSVAMGRATNGCIGVPVEFAARLFDVVDKGDIIEVVDGPRIG